MRKRGYNLGFWIGYNADMLGMITLIFIAGLLVGWYH